MATLLSSQFLPTAGVGRLKCNYRRAGMDGAYCSTHGAGFKSGYMVPIESINQPTHGRSRSTTKTATVGDVG